MLRCDAFGSEEPGCGVPGAQPFGVTVDPLVLAVMDFHSHLLSSEIIGFLGGHWDAQTRQLHLREAFPCRSIQADTGSVHVELDPLAEVQVRAAIEGRNMQVVGWYHSHPVFAPQPSIRDVQNQANYQYLFHDPTVNLMPFIGVIISPYDTRLSSTSSSMTMFYVEPNANAAGGTPKRISYCVHSLHPPPEACAAAAANGGPDEAAAASSGGSKAAVVSVVLPKQSAVASQPRMKLVSLGPEVRRYWEAALHTTCRALCALVLYYKRHRSRTQLKASWRKKQKAVDGSGSVVGAPPATKLDKLARSVRGRLVDTFSAECLDPLLAAVIECIEAHWVSSKGA